MIQHMRRLHWISAKGNLFLDQRNGMSGDRLTIGSQTGEVSWRILPAFRPRPGRTFGLLLFRWRFRLLNFHRLRHRVSVAFAICAPLAARLDP